MNVLATLRAAGVVGGGGAGFPTWKKLDTHAGTLILNAVECEPLLKTDQYLMRAHAREIVSALLAMAKQVDATRVVIALKEKYTREISALEEEIAVQRARIELHRMRAVYPAGDEHAVVHEVTGKCVPPGGLPGQVGAVVVSVSTAYNVHRALHGQSVTKRLLTVVGEVGSPKLIEAPVGASIAECIAAAGGASVQDFRVMLGGPMMGSLLPAGGERETVVTKTDSGILVLPPTHLLVNKAALSIEHMINRARSACIQCRYCTDMCPRYLLGHRMRPHMVMRAVAGGRIEDVTVADSLLCSECGVCELYACPMGMSPRRINQMLKPKLREKKVAAQTNSDDAQRAPRAYRQVPSRRIAARIGVERYDIPVPEHIDEVVPSRVNIPLRQHIGAMALAAVKTGESVRAGQTVGRMAEGALGADIHASIDGRVTAVGDSVVIERGRV